MAARARLARIELNGVEVAHDVELAAPGADSRLAGEAAMGPLILGGERGAFAVRALAYVRREAMAPLQLRGSRFRFYDGPQTAIGSYDAAQPTREGPADEPNAEMVSSARPFALVFTGTLSVPQTARHRFQVETEPFASSAARLRIDDTEIKGLIELSAGEHRYRLDYLRGSARGSPDLVWQAVAGGGAPQWLIRSTASVRNRPREPILVRADDGITVQRCFFAHRTGKKTHVVAVGSPLGRHWAYDPVTAALLAVWKGGFLDASEMWHERGFSQEGHPAGSVIELPGMSPFAGRVMAGGYTLGRDGAPSFFGVVDGQRFEDRLTVTREGLTRTITFGEGLPQPMRLTLATAAAIARTGERFAIGDRSYYIRAAGGEVQPAAGTTDARLTMTLPVGTTNFSYDLQW